MIVPLPSTSSIALFAASMTCGWLLAGHALGRQPAGTLEQALKVHPASRVLIGIPLVTGILLVIAAVNERWVLSFSFPAMYWGALILWWSLTCSLLALMVFATRAAYLRGDGERKKVALVTVLLTIALVIVNFYYPRPIADALEDDISPDGAILQSSDASCAAAAGANIARALGIFASERDVARSMGTTRLWGTNVIQMIIGMQKLGIACESVVTTTENSGELRLPALLLVDHPALGTESHAVAAMRRNGESFEVIDPLLGRETWSRRKLGEVWHGLAVSCRKEQ